LHAGDEATLDPQAFISHFGSCVVLVTLLVVPFFLEVALHVLESLLGGERSNHLLVLVENSGLAGGIGLVKVARFVFNVTLLSEATLLLDSVCLLGADARATQRRVFIAITS